MPLEKSFILNKRQFLFGILALLVGIGGYVFCRPADSRYLHAILKRLVGEINYIPGCNRALAGSAPDFFHALALSLMVMAFLSSRKSRTIACSAWFCIESVFELGQKYGIQLFASLPPKVGLVPVIGIIKNFFITGRFDLYDMAAFGFGCLTAFLSVN